MRDMPPADRSCVTPAAVAWPEVEHLMEWGLSSSHLGVLLLCVGIACALAALLAG